MSSINSISGQGFIPEIPKQSTPDISGETKSFGERIKNIMGDVNNLQLDAADIAEQFAHGEVEDIHDVMIAAEKAGVGLELVMEVRNRLVEAYREVTRMQM